MTHSMVCFVLFHSGHQILFGYNMPASIDLSKWTLTLPIGTSPRDPDEISLPELSTFSDQFFQRFDTYDLLTVPTEGAKTANTHFCRTEFREIGTSWSETNRMIVKQSVEKLPPLHPGLVVAQIHGPGAEYLVLVRVDGNRLHVRLRDSECGDLDTDFQLHSEYTLTVLDNKGTVTVHYTNKQHGKDATVVCPKFDDNNCYFKCGAYIQSTEPNAEAALKLYELQVSHSST